MAPPVEVESSFAVCWTTSARASADKEGGAELQIALGHGPPDAGAAASDENAFALEQMVGEHSPFRKG